LIEIEVVSMPSLVLAAVAEEAVAAAVDRVSFLARRTFPPVF
jgi:hypothetical protein